MAAVDGPPAVLQGRDLPLAAQVHRRPVDPGGAGRSPRALRQPGAGRARRRDRRLRQRRRPPLPRRPDAPRGGRDPAIIESIRAGLVFQLKEAVGTETIRRAGGAAPAAGGRGLARRARDRAARQPRPRAALDRLVRAAGRRRAATCTTTTSSRCSTTSSASSRAGAARAPAPTATGCSASTWTAPTSSSARSPAAARASSPAGCASTSTTSSPTWSSTTSSRRSAWSRGTAGSCSGDYRFDTATGLWRHRDGVVSPPLSLLDISYVGGRAVMPTGRVTGGEELLAEHLREGAALLASASGPDLSVPPRRR